MSIIKGTLSAFGKIYLGGLYYFSIVHIPHVVNNYGDMKKGTLPTIIKQIITWPVSMVDIVKNGNPALQFVQHTDQPTYDGCELKTVAIPKPTQVSETNQ